jgi:probable F420-dependent oxidoreductase
MKIGILGVGLDHTARPDVYGPFVSHADEQGFGTLWLPERTIGLSDFASRYPYARGSTAPAIPLDAPILNPFVSLAFAAAKSSTMRLGTGVTIVPELHPLVVAKLVASLDYLSGGRVVFGVGVGWLKEEFEALGVPWARRAERTKEYVAAMRAAWGSHTTTFKGEFVEFENVLSFPKPVAGPGLPVIYGGHSDAALRRAADYANGIYLFNLTAEEAAGRIATVRELLSANDRAGEPFEFVVAGVAEMTPDDLPAYREAGADELVVPFNRIAESGAYDPAQMAAAFAALAADWVAPAADLAAVGR